MTIHETPDQHKTPTARQFADVLFAVASCPDSPEPGRACRWCEAEHLAQWAATAGIEIPG